MTLGEPQLWESVAMLGALTAASVGALLARRFRRQRSSGGWSVDVALIVVGLLMAMPPLLRLWARLSPGGAPIGPDSDEAYVAALALERGALAGVMPPAAWASTWRSLSSAC